MKNVIKIEITKPAELDLVDIEYYITVELNNIQAADRIVDGIIDKITELCKFPRSAPLVFNDDLCEKEVRITRFENYNIIYQYDFQNQVISVTRILNERVDWQRKI